MLGTTGTENLAAEDRADPDAEAEAEGIARRVPSCRTGEVEPMVEADVDADADADADADGLWLRGDCDADASGSTDAAAAARAARGWEVGA
ncbi:hypothetical protein ACFVW1_15355 [Streptomyces olivochromogenes]|uniref:hypothetical protein n=1 Tax=Streptomyces olivochromogenes TaxID=1963 RepID=UPI0036D90037